ncbi:MAG: CDP-alcohol phosphatidyltransferase family protein [Dehalococcoidales bacterium]|nr:CDP-alcohol phosphatidyltransferase family protein [Dehalococcoidales bacterium]
MIKLAEARKSLAYHFTQPAVRLLAKAPVTPNFISWFGFLVTAGAAALIITEHFFAAGLVVLVAGFFDILDGALARSTNRVTRFGGVLDSTLDRLSEAVLLLGIMLLYAERQSVGGIMVAGVALVGSLMVSYVRARVEGIGLECPVGLFTRSERVVVLVLGLLVNQLIIALSIIMVFSYITVGQRLIYAWRQTKTQINLGGE